MLEDTISFSSPDTNIISIIAKAWRNETNCNTSLHATFMIGNLAE
jgi:hypothetical protein